MKGIRQSVAEGAGPKGVEPIEQGSGEFQRGDG